MAGYPDSARARLSGQADDYRGAFGRDRDRILYSSAFRRLAGKTQVVAAGELGDFHTRMTHSLKVAQVGRRLAELFRSRAVDRGLTVLSEPYPCPDPELVEAACLAHDLGHPPFGHAGEQALKVAVDEVALTEACGDDQREPTPEERLTAKDRGGFEGNAHTFRLLCALSARHPRGSHGLDLTKATLDATVKYPWYRGYEGKPETKWNFYPIDKEAAEWVRDGQSIGPGAPKSLEAQLMDWSDDVTYACHDVDDFYRAGIIPLDRLLDFPPSAPRESNTDDEPPEARRFLDWVARKWRDTFDRPSAIAALRSVGQLMLIDAPFDGRRASKVAAHRATSRLITYFLEGVSWTPEDQPPMLYEADLHVPDEIRLRCDLLQELIWYYVIARPALASQQHGQQTIVSGLLHIYAEADNDRLLPDDRREELEEHGDLLRAATDHVAALTEPNALALYKRLLGVDPGLHSDEVWRS